MTRVQVAIVLVAVIAVCTAARMKTAKKNALRAIMQANPKVKELLRAKAANKLARDQWFIVSGVESAANYVNSNVIQPVGSFVESNVVQPLASAYRSFGTSFVSFFSGW